MDKPCEQEEREKLMLELYERRSTIRSVVRRIVQRGEVEEVMADIHAALWKNIGNVPLNARARTSWLREVARRLGLAWVRNDTGQQGGKRTPLGRGGQRVATLPFQGNEAEASQALEQSTEHRGYEATLIDSIGMKERSKALSAALATLPHELREAYVLVKIQGISGKTAASRLGIARNTLLVRVNQARDLVAKHLSLGTVDCEVVNARREKLSARIRLRPEDKTKPTRSEETDHRSPAHFDGLPPGSYFIHARTGGYIDLEQTINIVPGLTRVTLTLEPKKTEEKPAGGSHD